MVSALIPAYNEEATIGPIVATLKNSSLINEVMVIDDGSDDETAQRALQAGARVIRMPQNQGKGEALNLGVEKAQGEILLFLDADLIGLTVDHLETLLTPVLKGSLEMSVGTLDRGNALNRWLPNFESPFAGMRVLKRSFWQEIPEQFKKGYFIESTLTYFAKEKGLTTKGFILKGLKHVVKERKYGLWLGLGHRVRMFGEIALANLLLRLHH